MCPDGSVGLIVDQWEEKKIKDSKGSDERVLRVERKNNRRDKFSEKRLWSIPVAQWANGLFALWKIEKVHLIAFVHNNKKIRVRRK